MRAVVTAFVATFLLGACDSERVFEDNVEFRDRKWKITQHVQFEFPIRDASKKYNLLINIRNSLDYPYARIFVNYNLTFDSTSLNKKMISAYLFDQKTGKPFGTSGIGDIYDHQFLILKNYSFKQTGNYKMKFDQCMRLDTIPGILSVGLRVAQVNE